MSGQNARFLLSPAKPNGHKMRIGLLQEARQL